MDNNPINHANLKEVLGKKFDKKHRIHKAFTNGKLREYLKDFGTLTCVNLL